MLEVVGVLGVGVETEPQEEKGIIFISMEQETKKRDWIFVYIRESCQQFINDRTSYVVLRGRWCYIFVLNAHAPTEDKSDYSTKSSYEELQQAFHPLPKYHTNTLL